MASAPFSTAARAQSQLPAGASNSGRQTFPEVSVGMLRGDVWPLTKLRYPEAGATSKGSRWNSGLFFGSFPNRHDALHFIDEELAGGERFTPMGRDHFDP